MKCTIDRTALKAVSRFAPAKDIRYYLVGVYVESSPLETRLIATDGHALIVHRAAAKGDNVGSWSGIIPLDTIKTLMKIKGMKNWTMEITDAGNGEYRIQYGSEAVIFRQIDGKFPDYRRVVPPTVNNETAHYDPELLMRVKNAAEDFGIKNAAFSLAHNGKGTGVCHITADCMALVMPMVSDPVDMLAVKWAAEPLPMPSAIDNVVPIAA